MSGTPITVVLADDHPTLRRGILSMLQADPDLHVVGEADSGPEAIRLVLEHRPDVLVLDVEIGDPNGVVVAERLAASDVATQVLAYSAYSDYVFVSGMFRAGAAGYLTKNKAPELLVEAVKAVARGEGRWFVSMKPSPRGADLSEREVEVLQLMARGRSNEEIADALFVSVNTVRNHVAAIYTKLGVRTWREAIAWAWEQGVVRR